MVDLEKWEISLFSGLNTIEEGFVEKQSFQLKVTFKRAFPGQEAKLFDQAVRKFELDSSGKLIETGKIFKSGTTVEYRKEFVKTEDYVKAPLSKI